MQREIVGVILAILLSLVGAQVHGEDMQSTSRSTSGMTIKTNRADSVVSQELFLKWRSPRLGSANPERMNNPVWEWLVRSERTAYDATQRWRGPCRCAISPSGIRQTVARCNGVAPLRQERTFQPQATPLTTRIEKFQPVIKYHDRY